MKIIQIPCLSDNYLYLLCSEATHQCIAIDAPEAGSVIKYLQDHKYTLEAIWNTHHHWDHIGANDELKKLYPDLKIFGYENDAHRIPGITHLLKQGDSVFAFNYENEFQVLFIPGHTLGHIGFYSENLKVLFCGDTLFAGGCGRLFEGTAEQLFHSLTQIIALLPHDTLIYCAHEYTLNNLKFALTIEPHNTHLLERYQTVSQLRKNNISTIPSRLSEEILTNPFLRTHCDELLIGLQKNRSFTPLEAFKYIRKLKDDF